MISEKIKKSTKKLFAFLKENKEKIIVFFQFLLVSLSSFFAGCLFFYEHSKSYDFKITQNAEILNAVQKYQENAHKKSIKDNGKFLYVASKKGRVYYKISCKNSIKDENKIFFKSQKEAESFGYKPSKRCFKKR